MNLRCLYSALLICIGSVLSGAHCAGGRATIRFEKLEYPVSTTAYVPGMRPEQTKVKGEFVISKRFWGILYSFIPLSDGDEMIQRLNQEIRSRSGRAVRNFTVESEACGINSVIILSILPIFPGCTIVTLKGEVTG